MTLPGGRRAWRGRQAQGPAALGWSGPAPGVGELRLLFEARCAAVAAAAAAGQPRARGAKRRGGQVPTGFRRLPLPQ